MAVAQAKGKLKGRATAPADTPIPADRRDPYGTPRARKETEARLYIELQACPECGHRTLRSVSTHRSVSYHDGVRVERLTAVGARFATCTEDHVYPFHFPDEQDRSTTCERWFGGPEPSNLLDPGQWLAYADRQMDAVPDPLPALGPDELAPLRTAAGLAAAAVAEVLKSVPDGADRVPRLAFWTEAGLRGYAEAPHRFERVTLEALLEAHAQTPKAMYS